MTRTRLLPLVASLALLALGIGCSSGRGDSSTTTESAKPSASEEPKKTDAGTTAAIDFEKEVKPVMHTYCVPCHLGAGKDNITLDDFQTNAQAAANVATLHKMLLEVEGGKMPPKNAKPIPADVKAKLIADMKAFIE
ncbi:MAG TPA: hypothetical protein PLL78_13750 [Fimbriimonadaceae bacterium]|nr:hypothetical protein [Fimbriimonadaceae bacterium]HRJ97739.1 hypothetical protein [Fimbriimonadaceae bacterium]